MAKPGMLKLSLAAKCRLLFGLAVVLIIASALFVPWYSLETLIHDRNLQQARYLALLARAQIDPFSTDWARQQVRLDQWWGDNAKLLTLPETRPQLVHLPLAGSRPAEPDRLASGFRAMRRLVTPPLRTFARHIPVPLPARVASGAWKGLPESERTRLAEGTEHLLAATMNMLAPSPLALDEFQRKCVRAMTEDDGLNKMQTIEHPRGEPTRYRYVLAVRGEESGTGHRPLIGMVDVKLDAADSDEALLWIRLVVILAGFLAGFLAILVFYVIVQKFILAPVRDLTVLSGEIAAGDLSARASIATGDEFEDLADAFNDMLGKLEKARVELETINRSLDTRLGELAETNVALFESNRLKSEFLANVSHELRTPLTSILGFADLLRDSVQSEGPIDKTRYARFTSNILISGRMLLDLINDLLDLAKIEAGRVELHRSRLSLVDICEGLADFMRPLVDKKQLALAIDVDESLPLMISDAGKIRQILYNLLSNAIKYTPDNGQVRVEAASIENGTQIRIVVSDTGPGIAPEDQERIFEKFRQLDSSVTREHGGSGLGLAISRELALLLGGTIRVESELGRGSRFIVVLPVESPEAVQRPMPILT